MIVCSCNILTDRDIRELAADPDYVPPRIAAVYERLGCKAECGRCARTIATIMRESVTMLSDASHGETPADLSMIAVGDVDRDGGEAVAADKLAST